MNIAILSGGDGWHVRDIQRAATELGHHADAVDFRRLNAWPGQNPLKEYDVALVRTMPPGSLEQVVFRMDLLHAAVGHGVRVINPPRAVECCVDKYLTSVRLAEAGLPIPRTFACPRAEEALEVFEQLGGDVVIKPLFGSEGRGMVRVSDPELAWRTFRAIERTQAILYVQEFVPNPGWDLRVFVLDGRVLTAMRRFAVNGWRTNVTQGGHGEIAILSEEEEQLALRGAEAVGTTLAGVDLIPTGEGGWKILEVNAVPGWRALAGVTGIDIAREIVAYLAEGKGP